MIAFAYFVNGLLMFVLPLALGVWLARRRKQEWGLFGIGALTFFASQVLHIPFNQFILMPALGADLDPQVVTDLVGALAVGLSAGVFEETARYVAMRRMKPAERGFDAALMFGAGHGGLEAIILGGLVLYALLQAVTLRGVDLTQVVPADQVEQTRAQLETFWDAAPLTVLMGAVERVAAIMFHLMASVLVMTAVQRKRPGYLVLAIGFHTLFNAVALLILEIVGVYVTEAVLVAMGLAGILSVRGLRGTLTAPPAEGAPALRPEQARRVSALSDGERLDDSRFL